MLVLFWRKLNTPRAQKRGRYISDAIFKSWWKLFIFRQRKQTNKQQEISRNLTAARYQFKVVRSLGNLSGASTRHLLNFRAIQWFNTQSCRFETRRDLWLNVLSDSETDRQSSQKQVHHILLQVPWIALYLCDILFFHSTSVYFYSMAGHLVRLHINFRP